MLLTPVIKDSNKHLRTIAPAGYNYKWTRIKAVLARNIVLQRTSIFQYTKDAVEGERLLKSNSL